MWKQFNSSLTSLSSTIFLSNTSSLLEKDEIVQIGVRGKKAEKLVKVKLKKVGQPEPMMRQDCRLYIPAVFADKAGYIC